MLAGPRVRDYRLHLGFAEGDFEHVMFLGFVPPHERPFLHSAADLFGSTSFSGECPITPMDTTACGMRIMGSEVGGTPGIVGDAALRPHPVGPDEFAEKMRIVLEHPAPQREVRERGFRRVSVFSFDSRTSLVLPGLPEAVGPCKGH